MFGFITYSAPFGIGPERDHDFVLAAGVGRDLAALLRADGHRAVTADEGDAVDGSTLPDGPLSSATVLAAPHVQRELARAGCTTLVPFKSNRRLEQLAAQLGITLLAAPAQLVRQLENKLSLPDIALAAGVRAPRSRALVVGPDEAIADGELPLVFQPAVSFAGAGTRPLRSRADVDALIAEEAGTAGKLAELVDGEPICVTGVALADGETLVGQVTRQLTSIAACNPHPLGSSGNDWSLTPADEVVTGAREACALVGSVLAARGFQGLFGIDLVATPAGEVVLIEVNPRCTASLSLQLQLQQLDGGPTLLDAHLAAFDHVAGDREALLARLRERFAADVPPAYAGAHEQAASVIVFNPAAKPATLRALSPGIYRVVHDPRAGGEPGVVPGPTGLDGDVAGSTLAFVRSGYRVDHLATPDEVLVLAQGDTRPVPAGAEMARIVFRRPVVSGPRADRLLPHAAAAVDAVRAAIDAPAPVAHAAIG